MIIARADTANGEVLLRRRNGVDELIVNGVFAMDSAEVGSERTLAEVAGRPLNRVLVGGLGLGYTTSRLLELGAKQVTVAELAEPLLRWAKDGVTEQLGRLAADPRVLLVHADVAELILAGGANDGWDAIILDVDNGPSFLIHQHNQRVYESSFLSECLRRLTPNGRLLIWCETASPDLAIALNRVAREVELVLVPVAREGRSFEYAIYRARPR